MDAPEDYAEKLIRCGFTRAEVADRWRAGELQCSAKYLLSVLDAWGGVVATRGLPEYLPGAEEVLA